MSLAGQNQVRQMYVGLTYPGHANVAAVKAGDVSALAVLSADGTAVGANKPLVFLTKDASGKVVTSDIIKPKQILYAKSKGYVAPVLGSTTISAITVNANTLYTVEIAIKQFGSFSVENEYIKKAFYKAAAGNTAENIVDGLILSLNRNFSREIDSTATYNPYFTFSKTGTGASAALVITEKTDWLVNSYRVGKMTRTKLDFTVNAKFTTVPTFTVVDGSRGVGSGYEVLDMEYYLQGERNDYMRGAGYPHNFDNTYISNKTANYNFVEIGYFEEGRDEAKKSKKSITIAMPFTDLAGNSVINTMIANLNTALGAGTIATLPVA